MGADAACCQEDESCQREYAFFCKALAPPSRPFLASTRSHLSPLSTELFLALFIIPLRPAFSTKSSCCLLNSLCALRARSMSPHSESPILDGEGYGLKQCELLEEARSQQQVGSIHLILGPMFAGKTTALLKRVEAEAREGRNVAMVKSDKDTRYGLGAIVSHDGKRMPCWAVPSLASFRDQMGEAAYAKVDVIGIDEAQFLGDLYNFCQAAADHEGKTLIVAGLDGDFLRNRFGSVLDLVPLADSVVKLSSYCELCRKPALFTFRKLDESQKEIIGGTDVYMPVCRQHYFSGKLAMETARTVLEARRILSLQCDNVAGLPHALAYDNVAVVHQ